MTDNYILTAAAEAEVRQIVRYTRQQWGEEQVRTYMAKLERGLSRLAAGQWTCTGFVPVTYLIMPPWLRMRAG